MPGRGPSLPDDNRKDPARPQGAAQLDGAAMLDEAAHLDRSDAAAVEALADYAHGAWAGWMQHLFSNCQIHPNGSITIPADLVERWQRQIGTAYADLTPAEQESDRVEARAILRRLHDLTLGLWPATTATQEPAPGRPPERQTCPRRIGEIGPWEYKPGLDRWLTVGEDRVCSFCGSMHPADFEQFLQRVIEDPECRLTPSTKTYKIYIDRPRVRNAGDGAIKYYQQHNYTDPDDIARIEPLFREALKVSHERRPQQPKSSEE